MLGSHYPERLRVLVLSSTSAYAGPPENWDKRIALIQNQGLQAVVDATIDRWFTKTGQEEMPLEIARVRNMILNTPVQGFCACCQAIRRYGSARVHSLYIGPHLGGGRGARSRDPGLGHGVHKRVDRILAAQDLPRRGPPGECGQGGRVHQDAPRFSRVGRYVSKEAAISN